MLNELILITLLLAACLYWLSGQQVKEIALKAVKSQCSNLDVQMLDEYVALTGIRLARDQRGKIRLQRLFSFEFSSTGNDRYNGVCMMLGRQVESIRMEPHRFDES
ncbi:MAG: DUF3301 domain-containing protein [Methylobacter sp.]|nr:DUF3301 domain-containing protein [Methylobacter sp.]